VTSKPSGSSAEQPQPDKPLDQLIYEVAYNFAAEFCGGSESVGDVLIARLYQVAAAARPAPPAPGLREAAQELLDELDALTAIERLRFALTAPVPTDLGMSKLPCKRRQH
jgi:hypothetical protein